MKLKEQIRDLLLKNDLSGLESLLVGKDIDSWSGDLVDIAYDTKSLLAYTLICMMLMKQESSRLHSLATALLSHSLCYIEGAYASACYHMRRAVALDPKNVGYKEALLFFHEIPEQLLNKEEAIKLASEVLEKDPGSKAAQDIIKRYK